MENRVLTEKMILEYKNHLIREEKSPCTIEKYIRDVRRFMRYVKDQNINKERVISYKQTLIEQGYKVRSINSMLAALMSLFHYMHWDDCKVKSLKIV